MAQSDQDTIKKAWKHFEKANVLNIGELATALKCSIPSARLKIKDWKAFTSYNHNGRFYTLPHVPRFDRHGLWRYKDIAFSMHGNLKKTVIHLVTSASAGYTGRQLGELLGLSPRSFLHHFRKCPGICREKQDGVYVYFSDDISEYEKQMWQRNLIVCRTAVDTISEQEAIMILVAIIRHHGISAVEILALPEI